MGSNPQDSISFLGAYYKGLDLFSSKHNEFLRACDKERFKLDLNSNTVRVVFPNQSNVDDPKARTLLRAVYTGIYEPMSDKYRAKRARQSGSININKLSEEKQALLKAMLAKKL